MARSELVGGTLCSIACVRINEIVVFFTALRCLWRFLGLLAAGLARSVALRGTGATAPTLTPLCCRRQTVAVPSSGIDPAGTRHPCFPRSWGEQARPVKTVNPRAFRQGQAGETVGCARGKPLEVRSLSTGSPAGRLSAGSRHMAAQCTVRPQLAHKASCAHVIGVWGSWHGHTHGVLASLGTARLEKSSREAWGSVDLPAGSAPPRSECFVLPARIYSWYLVSPAGSA